MTCIVHVFTNCGILGFLDWNLNSWLGWWRVDKHFLLIRPLAWKRVIYLLPFFLRRSSPNPPNRLQNFPFSFSQSRSPQRRQRDPGPPTAKQESPKASGTFWGLKKRSLQHAVLSRPAPLPRSHPLRQSIAARESLYERGKVSFKRGLSEMIFFFFCLKRYPTNSIKGVQVILEFGP